jgi:hypothetical protein
LLLYPFISKDSTGLNGILSIKTTKFNRKEKIMLVFALYFCFSCPLRAQDDLIPITPISIVKNIDLNFGNIAVSSAGGAVILAPNGTRTSTGGVTLPATTGSTTTAKFTVTGENYLTYTILLPTSDLILTETLRASETMTVNAFTSTPNTIGIITTGTAIIMVGATLNVSALQPKGLYTNSNGFEVIVHYN